MSGGFSHMLRVDQVPSAGRHVRIVADSEALKVIAETLRIAEVADFTAEFDVRPASGAAFQVRGTVRATVVQTDVVSLEPLRQAIEEPVDLRLVPEESISEADATAAFHNLPEDRDVYRDGRIDLGAIAVEHLALGLDPYPRAPGTAFEGYSEGEGDDASPFAALARWKHDQK
jgi:hypothetical protein